MVEHAIHSFYPTIRFTLPRHKPRLGPRPGPACIVLRRRVRFLGGTDYVEPPPFAERLPNRFIGRVFVSINQLRMFAVIWLAVRNAVVPLLWLVEISRD